VRRSPEGECAIGVGPLLELGVGRPLSTHHQPMHRQPQGDDPSLVMHPMFDQHDSLHLCDTGWFMVCDISGQAWCPEKRGLTGMRQVTLTP
jgi:hypothetical protein